jgi:hypothetical protein
MTARTWNLKLMATEDHPETALEGVSEQAATSILRELMYGSLDRTRLQEVVADARADRTQADRRDAALAA